MSDKQKNDNEMELGAAWPAKSGRPGHYTGNLERDVADRVLAALGLAGSKVVLTVSVNKPDGNKPCVRVRLWLPDGRPQPAEAAPAGNADGEEPPF